MAFNGSNNALILYTKLCANVHLEGKGSRTWLRFSKASMTLKKGINHHSREEEGNKTWGRDRPVSAKLHADETNKKLHLSHGRLCSPTWTFARGWNHPGAIMLSQYHKHTTPWPPTPPLCRVPVGGTQPAAYFSMAATCRVSILPLVWRVEDVLPPNKRPALAIFSRMSLTSSPRYRPLIIFSNLQFGKQISGSNAFGYAACFPKAQEPRPTVRSMSHGRAAPQGRRPESPCNLGYSWEPTYPLWVIVSSPIKVED